MFAVQMDNFKSRYSWESHRKVHEIEINVFEKQFFGQKSDFKHLLVACL